MTTHQARLRALASGHDDWYRIEAFSGAKASIYLYDLIGGWFGITAESFVRELMALTVDEIDLHLNSPGGDYFDAVAIYNSLRQHPATITTYVDGLAASAASVVAMAGARIVMGTGSQLMIHDARGIEIGTAAAMRSFADLLDACSDDIAGFYARRAGGDTEAWREAMRAETWYRADEAVAAGLADEVATPPARSEPDEDEGDLAARDDRWIFATYRYAGRAAAPAPPARVPDPPPPAFDRIAVIRSAIHTLPRTAR